VLGGAGFSILPQEILEYLDADMGIQGEAETIFPTLLSYLKSGKQPADMPGLFRKGKPPASSRTYVKHLDTLQLPNPALISRTLTGAENAPVPVQTRRGCPLSCSYCSTPTIEGRRMRWRSPEMAVSWIARWVQEGFRNFYFVDNTFNLPPSYAMHLCSKIINAGLDISWRCILFPTHLHPKLVETMAEAGCKEVSIGFESGSEGMLRRMHKPFSLKEVRHAIDLLSRYNIRRMGFLLLGGPGETKDSVKESLAFAEDLNLNSLKLTVGIRIYPHTDIAKTAREEGLISSEHSLLHPRFYIVRELEDWIYNTLAARISTHPHWIF